MDNKLITQHAEIMRKLSAYVLFLEKGKAAVKRMYPDLLAFVTSQEGKTFSEVEEFLNQNTTETKGSSQDSKTIQVIADYRYSKSAS